LPRRPPANKERQGEREKEALLDCFDFKGEEISRGELERRLMYAAGLGSTVANERITTAEEAGYLEKRDPHKSMKGHAARPVGTSVLYGLGDVARHDWAFLFHTLKLSSRTCTPGTDHLARIYARCLAAAFAKHGYGQDKHEGNLERPEFLNPGNRPIPDLASIEYCEVVHELEELSAIDPDTGKILQKAKEFEDILKQPLEDDPRICRLRYTDGHFEREDSSPIISESGSVISYILNVNIGEDYLIQKLKAIPRPPLGDGRHHLVKGNAVGMTPFVISPTDLTSLLEQGG